MHAPKRAKKNRIGVMYSRAIIAGAVATSLFSVLVPRLGLFHQTHSLGIEFIGGVNASCQVSIYGFHLFDTLSKCILSSLVDCYASINNYYCCFATSYS